MVICNMLIGVLCAVVIEMSIKEKDQAAVTMMRDTVFQHLQQCDDGDGLVTEAELNEVLNKPTSRAVLEELKVDMLFVKALQAIHFKGKGKHIPIHSITELMLSCRGDKPATVHTVSSSIAFLVTSMRTMENHLRRHENH